MLSRPAILKFLDSLLGPFFCRLLSSPQQETEYPAIETLDGPVLLIRPGGIGDAVMTLPLLSVLRKALPKRKIHVLCEGRNRDLYQLADPDLHLMSYDTRPFETLRYLRSTGYSIVFDTEQYHHFSAVMAALTRAPIRAGFKINTRRNALYTHLTGYDLDGAEDMQFARLAAAVIPEEHIHLPDKFGLLAQADLPLPSFSDEVNRAVQAGCLAVVHAGGSVPEKRWHTERYAALCDRLADIWNLQPVLIGGASDKALANSIMQLARKPPLNLCGKLELSATAALCRAARVFIGPDSGIAHLATATGTASVVLFGPSDPGKWGPGKQGRVVRHPVPCGPCAIFGYNKPCRTYACMDLITVDDVMQATDSLLQTDCNMPDSVRS